MVALLTLVPVRRWYSHAASWSVRSGRSATISRTTGSCSAGIFGGCPPPYGRGASAPVSRFSRFQRWTVASPIWNSFAAASSVSPPRCKAAMTRSRKSTESPSP
jgi:hypothetical protein